jgi:cell division protein FtsZ
MHGARGVLINITGGKDISLHEVDQAVSRIAREVDEQANIIFGSTLDESMDGRMRVSVVATGIDADKKPAQAEQPAAVAPAPLLPAGSRLQPALPKQAIFPRFAAKPPLAPEPVRAEAAAVRERFVAPQPVDPGAAHRREATAPRAPARPGGLEERSPSFLEKVASSFGRTRAPEPVPARPEPPQPARREPALTAAGEESTYDIPAFLRFR